MKTYTIEHKYIGTIATVQGFDKWHALKSNGYDVKIWTVKAVW